jgi:hypothetical protein
MHDYATPGSIDGSDQAPGELPQTIEISLVAGLSAPTRPTLIPLEFPQHVGVSNQYARARAAKTAGLYGRRR